MTNRFDQEALEWDTPYRVSRAQAIAAEIKKRVHFKPDDNVLEFGCGTALVSTNLYYSVGKISLMDTSTGMLQVALQKFEKLGTGKPVTAFSDLFSNSLTQASFDCIYTSMVLHHVLDLKEVGERFYNLLKENGTLCIVDLNPDDGSFHADDSDFDGHNGFDPEALSGDFSTYGFSREYCSTFYSSVKKTDEKDVPYSLFIMVMKKH